MNLSILDWTVIAAYFLFNLGIGIYYARRAGAARANSFCRDAMCRGGSRARRWLQRPLRPIRRLQSPASSPETESRVTGFGGTS